MVIKKVEYNDFKKVIEYKKDIKILSGIWIKNSKVTGYVKSLKPDNIKEKLTNREKYNFE